MKALGAGVLFLFGAIFVLTGLFGDDKAPATSFAFGLFCCLAGAALVRSLVRSEQEAMGTRVALDAAKVTVAEEEVLACAERHGGRVTATDVADDLGVPFQAAHEALEAAAKRGECAASSVGSGLVYAFSEPALKRGRQNALRS